MIGIRIACDGTSVSSGPIGCPYLAVDGHVDIAEALAPQIEQYVTGQGWAVENPTPETVWTEPRYFCPVHNPALKGQLFQLERERYLHLGNGVYARLNPDQDALRARIDVQIRDTPAPTPGNGP